MVATVHISSYHGAAGATVTDVESTTIRFKKADNDTADFNNRMPIPTSLYEYSYLKHLALRATTTPAALIDTLKMYGDGGLPTGVEMMVQDAVYLNPTTNLDTPLAAWSNNYAGFTSAAKLSLAGSIANPATGKINTNYLQMQMRVGSSAAAGVMTAETCTLEYLES